MLATGSIEFGLPIEPASILCWSNFRAFVVKVCLSLSIQRQAIPQAEIAGPTQEGIPKYEVPMTSSGDPRPNRVGYRENSDHVGWNRPFPKRKKLWISDIGSTTIGLASCTARDFIRTGLCRESEAESMRKRNRK